MSKKSIFTLSLIVLIALGIVLTALLETKILIGTYSGTFTIVIKENDAWNFKYIWLNLNSISIEDALNIIGKYKSTLYDAMASSTPTSIYGKEEWVHIMFFEPPHSISSLDESIVRILGLNITSLNPANAVLTIEIINPEGEIDRYELSGSIGKNTLPKYFYAKVLKKAMFTFLFPSLNSVLLRIDGFSLVLCISTKRLLH